jgi:hypothetical protein
MRPRLLVRALAEAGVTGVSTSVSERLRCMLAAAHLRSVSRRAHSSLGRGQDHSSALRWLPSSATRHTVRGTGCRRAQTPRTGLPFQVIAACHMEEATDTSRTQ